MIQIPDITLICVGAVKDPHIGALVDGYLKRLRREARIEVREIRDGTPVSEGDDVTLVVSNGPPAGN